MQRAELRARLAAGARTLQVVRASQSVSVPADAIAVPAAESLLGFAADELVRAAVLVPILTGPAPCVLLTKRTTHLSRHPGQVSFPGGRIDPDDADAEAAALREAQEEIGLHPEAVEIAGRLPDQITGTGYVVTPVIGLLGPTPPDLELSPEEVEALVELPLAVLLDPAAPQRRRAESRGRLREFWVWPHPEHDIWGATAAILVQLARRLRGEA
jgi:8-oxo-dGTP pyrophosphatase MutT (NUDIX family)